MRIGLIDVDGHNFPNVALMKIASWHRKNGDNVEWALPMFGEYDRIYASKVFTFTPDYNPIEYNAKEFIGGGYWIRHQVKTARRNRQTYGIGIRPVSTIQVLGSVLFKRMYPSLSVLSCKREGRYDT